MAGFIMAGFIPAIHVFSGCVAVKTWMRGSSPRMTVARPVAQNFHFPTDTLIRHGRT
jgi:hypothetical protein